MLESMIATQSKKRAGSNISASVVGKGKKINIGKRKNDDAKNSEEDSGFPNSSSSFSDVKSSPVKKKTSQVKLRNVKAKIVETEDPDLIIPTRSRSSRVKVAPQSKKIVPVRKNSKENVSKHNSNLEQPVPEAQNAETKLKTTRNVKKTTPVKKNDTRNEVKKVSDINSTQSNSKSRKKPVVKISSKEKCKETKIKREKSVEDVNMLDVSQLLALGEGNLLEETEMSVDSGNSDSDSDSEQSDWEEVETKPELKEPVIPKDGVDITLEVPNIFKKKKKKGFDMEAHIKRQLNRVKRELQVLIHKVHFLCWIGHLKFVNRILNSEMLMALALSLLTSNELYPPKHASLGYLERISKWFNKHVILKENVKDEKCTGGLETELCYQFNNKFALTRRYLAYMFIVMLRMFGLKVRLVVSLQVVPIRPSSIELSNARDNPSKVKNKKDEPSVSTGSSKYFDNDVKKMETPKPSTSKVKNEGLPARVKRKVEELNSDDESLSKHFKTKRQVQNKGKQKVSQNKMTTPVQKDKKSNSSDSDSEFTPESIRKKARMKKEIDRRVLSSEEEGVGMGVVNKKRVGSDVWVEVFVEAEEKWICVDIGRQKIHCINELFSRASQPVTYILACNNDSTIKDVTKRYVPHWHSETRRRRVEENWLNESLQSHRPPHNAFDREEDEDIDRQLMDKPLPTSIGEYKAHPLYALKRHLLKFEGLYPPNTPTLGFVRGEPVYARDCVVTLRSREIWFKEARVVRLKEEPYKIVKARPKWDKMTGELRKDLPLELFGVWQTEDYIPPIATGGKVPRNEYGNVDLFKPCMLPGGTVHLPIPGLQRVAKKLGIDCAPATVGFEFHSGGSHPVQDGFVVCEEFKEVLLDAWNTDIDESAKRNEEKREKRVYGNWRKLIRGLLIKEKLKLRYDFGGEGRGLEEGREEGEGSQAD